MAGLTTVHLDIFDTVWRQALTEILNQGKEIKVLDSIETGTAPDVIIVNSDQLGKTKTLNRCRDCRSENPHSSIILLSKYRLKPGAGGEAVAGADDYLHKPFKIRDLISSIRLEIRNRQWLANDPIKIGPLAFFPGDRIIRDGSGAEVFLTTLETRLLHRLYRGLGRGVSRRTLLDEVWGYHESANTTTVQAHIHRLRGKLRGVSGEDDLIFSSPDGYGIRADTAQ